MIVSLTTRELERIFEITPADQNILLVGRHGIGKSSIVTNWFTSQGLPVVTLFLGQMSDPGDLIGLPRINEESDKTEFIPPYWFPTDGKPIVLFLDELNRARQELLQSVMDLVLNRRLAGRQLPEGSRVISAVNGGDEYQVGELDPALVSRFNVYDFRPSKSDWLTWAHKEGLDGRVIDFLSVNPGLLDAGPSASDGSLDRFPDRRAWERVGRIMLGIVKVDTFTLKLLSGIVGSRAASKFIQSLSDQNLTARDVLMKPEAVLPRLKDARLEQLAAINEGIFQIIDVHDFSISQEDKICNGLTEYIKWLEDSEKREPLAQFVNIFASDNYATANDFIISRRPLLYRTFVELVKSLSDNGYK